VFRSLAAVLRPGALLRAEWGAAGNCASIETALAALGLPPLNAAGIGQTVVVEVSAAAMGARSPQGLPYTAPPPAGSAPDGARRLVATAVPYFQWDNRDGRAMRVWLPAAG
jgi:hypothetical protein